MSDIHAGGIDAPVLARDARVLARDARVQARLARAEFFTVVVLCAAGLGLAATLAGQAGLLTGLDLTPPDANRAFYLFHPFPLALGLAVAALVAATRTGAATRCGAMIHLPLACATVLLFRWFDVAVVARVVIQDPLYRAVGNLVFHAVYSLGVWTAAALFVPELRRFRLAVVSYVVGDVYAIAELAYLIAYGAAPVLLSTGAFVAYIVPVAWALSRAPGPKPAARPPQPSPRFFNSPATWGGRPRKAT